MTKYPVIVLVGPTAAGKTSVAIDLARRIDGEIISADSRQFFRRLDIGTAKPTAAEQAQARHHFVDFLPLDADYSAGAFSRQARERIDELRQRGINVVVAGGSGMYVTALLDGFFAPTVRDKALQQQLKVRARQEGADTLYAELQRVDPARAAELHANDLHRIVRALEVYYATGERLSELQQQPRVPAAFPFRLFGLRWPRQTLYHRIEARVDAMLEAGLEAEVRALLDSGVDPQINALQTVGYREMIDYLRGTGDRDEMVALIKQRTRNFAKRQMTWFRKDQRIHWLDVEDETGLAAVASQIVALVQAG